MKIECVLLHNLQPEDFTKSLCSQHNISSNSADHCKEMPQLWGNRPAGEVLSHINLIILVNTIMAQLFSYVMNVIAYIK